MGGPLRVLLNATDALKAASAAVRQAAALTAVVNQANLHGSRFSKSHRTNGISSFFVN
jgi:hypothetical protein